MGIYTALGAIAGGQPDTKKSFLEMANASQLENSTTSGVSDDYAAMRKLTAQGPGETDITSGLNSQRSLADMFGAYAKSGGLPTDADISTGSSYAAKLFAPQQESLRQSFVDQTTQANRLAASLGRNVDDPILQAKLRTSMMNQQGMLAANQNAYGTQMALNLPGQRLGYAQGQTNILSGLASQAFSNRSALLSLGSQLQSAERNFRVQTATQHSEQGGGEKGAIAGGIAGHGADVATMKTIMSMVGGGMMGGGGMGGMGGGGGDSGAYAGAAAGISGGMGSGGGGFQMGGMSSPAMSTYNYASPYDNGAIQGMAAGGSYMATPNNFVMPARGNNDPRGMGNILSMFGRGY